MFEVKLNSLTIIEEKTLAQAYDTCLTLIAGGSEMDNIEVLDAVTGMCYTVPYLAEKLS